MVGKLSDDAKMSGSRIPTLYCWQYGDGHPYKTPNEELAASIAAHNNEPADRGDIGEPGIVGNLLEPALALSACEELGIPDPELTPDVIRTPTFEVSCDAISTLQAPWKIHASDIVSLVVPDADGDARYPQEMTLSGHVPIEVKCTSDYATDEPPLHRGPVQLQMQMMGVSAEYGVIITLHRGIERRITVYRRSFIMQERIADLCRDFQQRVESGRYYPPISVDHAAKAPASEEKTETDISDLDDDIDRLERLKADRRAFDEEIEKIETRIMSAIGDAHVGTTPRYRVEWPVRHYKPQPEKITPAKEARTIRLKTLKIKPMV